MSTPPTVGRIVHYRSYGTPGGEYAPQCRAAVVTEVGYAHDEQAVGLAVLNPTGLFFDRAIPHAPAREVMGGTWHWPCARVEES